MIKRRLIAAVLLLVFATGSPLLWNNGVFDALHFGVNFALAGIGFLVLHHKWKHREDRMVTPDKARDIFS